MLGRANYPMGYIEAVHARVSRVLKAFDKAKPAEPFATDVLLARLRAAAPDASIVTHELLERYDAYYYSRNRQAALPVLRVKFDDPLETWVYVDPELGQIVAGSKAGRERDDETILFWHRGLSLSDIALGKAMLDKAKRLGIGQRLRYA